MGSGYIAGSEGGLTSLLMYVGAAGSRGDTTRVWWSTPEMCPNDAFRDGMFWDGYMLRGDCWV